MEKLRVFTAFSGYDSQCLALDRLNERYGLDYELVGWSEIDKYAIQAHNAIYPQWADRNFGDISKIDWSQVPDFDLFTYGSPCSDFSKAGKMAGGEEGSGTRSSLLWECRRAIEAKRPKYCLMENVANLVGKKFVNLFNKWQLTLDKLGYYSCAKILNSKNYGVNQERKRVFLVSNNVGITYNFPAGTLTKKRTICLNSKVDGRQPSLEHRIYSTEGLMPTITTSFMYSVQDNGDVRKLTPRECFRLMDVDDNIIDKIQAAGISNSQQYKLAGNSIVVACLEKILEQLFYPQYTNSGTLF